MPNKIEQEVTKSKKLSIIGIAIGCVSLIFNIVLLFIIL